LKLEAALVACDGVSEVAVVDRSGSDGTATCVAYVVPEKSEIAQKLAGEEWLKRLRVHVRSQPDRLPVPDELVVLEALPRTVDGEVSRRELPDPRRARTPAYVAPQGPTEERLAALWCDLLKVKRVGREDNFFDLGGHSLVASQLAARVRITFATELPLRTLFDAQTLHAQAAAIQAVGLRARFEQNRQSLDDYGGTLDEGEI
jgi:hypothetical protein